MASTATDVGDCVESQGQAPRDPTGEALDKFFGALRPLVVELFRDVGLINNHTLLVEDRIRSVSQGPKEDLTPSESTKLAKYRALEPYDPSTSLYNSIVFAEGCRDRRIALYEQLLSANDISSARVHFFPYHRLDEVWNSRVALDHVPLGMCLDRILADLKPADSTIGPSKPSRAVIIDGCNDYWFTKLYKAHVYREARKANVLLIVSYGVTESYDVFVDQAADCVLAPAKYAVWDRMGPTAYRARLSVQCKNLCVDDDTDGTRTLAQLEDGNYLVFAKDADEPRLLRHCI